ncbi:hypothetical protein E2C01_098418 [Portunus trituberculatus]|uniref:Uncharacterized protein n=1 Tax=Portunus trituberculatus TaxID=210409 RepID=A0A5B7K2Y2_PORTR|nr:hypothetical protein [Portunus trituberculatus]
MREQHLQVCTRRLNFPKNKFPSFPSPVFARSKGTGGLRAPVPARCQACTKPVPGAGEQEASSPRPAA